MLRLRTPLYIALDKLIQGADRRSGRNRPCLFAATDTSDAVISPGETGRCHELRASLRHGAVPLDAFSVVQQRPGALDRDN